MVEAEDLVHLVGLGLHRQAEHGQGLATAGPEQHLWEQGAQHQDAGLAGAVRTGPARGRREPLPHLPVCAGEGARVCPEPRQVLVR